MFVLKMGDDFYGPTDRPEIYHSLETAAKFSDLNAVLKYVVEMARTRNYSFWNAEVWNADQLVEIPQPPPKVWKLLNRVG